MARVLYYLHDFPQLSQSYVRVELEAVAHRMTTSVVAMGLSSSTYHSAHPFVVLPSKADVVSFVKETKPNVIHSHWLYMTEHVFDVAKTTDIPFTIRAHSFDTLPMIREFDDRAGMRETFSRIKAKRLLRNTFFRYSPWYLYGISHFVNHPLCLGILSFPFSRENLETAGIASEKIVDCYPVLDFQRFYNRSPNGEAVMNVGITSPKKGAHNFIDLARLVPERKFNLYAVLDANLANLEAYNRLHGNQVEILHQTPFEAMPTEYKKHAWLVYTSMEEMSTVGWPVVVAEAQAAGVGVCIQNVRPDLQQYLGGAGYVFDSIDDLRDIVKSDLPNDKREHGYRQARKSDIHEHLPLLYDLWRPATGAI